MTSADTIISIFLGVGLAASVGFRVFLPLFILSLAAFLGKWRLPKTMTHIIGSFKDSNYTHLLFYITTLSSTGIENWSSGWIA